MASRAPRTTARRSSARRESPRRTTPTTAGSSSGSITKVVDKTDVEISQGGSATFTYTVTATPGQVVGDGTSSWSGSVSVTNPSQDEALTVDIDDIPVVAGWTCSFDDDNTQVEIAAGGAVELDYTCSGTGHPSGTNTAVVELRRRRVGLRHRGRGVRAAGRSPTRWRTSTTTRPTRTHRRCRWARPTPRTARRDFTYEVVKLGTAGACTTYTNTAWAALEASEDLGRHGHGRALRRETARRSTSAVPAATA